MALEMNDLMMLKSLGKEDMTPYEQFKTQHMQAKEHTGGVAITGMVTGIAGLVIGGTAWLFSGLYGNAKANQAREAAYAAKELANAQIGSTQRQLDQLTNLFAAERQERINGDITLNATITDSVSGQQASTLTAQQQAELAASQVATQTVMTGLMTGRYSENPQRVALYQDAKPCACPMSGCGCNG